MKKIISTIVLSTIILGTAQLAFAEDGTEAGSQQTINGETSADIQVNGTLGADNTDPDATIPEGDANWINVTVPTKTIFYNTSSDSTIKAPTYSIVNNSGRPVTVTANGFTTVGQAPTVPNDFALNLLVTGTNGNTATTASTKLIENGALVASVNSPLITLANSKNQMLATDPAASPVNNQATFTYGGNATATQQTSVEYTLNLKFDSVSWN
ncbi:hypothetical protein ACYSNW_06425 [Enterococcus sp. LJL99]